MKDRQPFLYDRNDLGNGENALPYEGEIVKSYIKMMTVQYADAGMGHAFQDYA